MQPQNVTSQILKVWLPRNYSGNFVFSAFKLYVQNVKCQAVSKIGFQDAYSFFLIPHSIKNPIAEISVLFLSFILCITQDFTFQ